MPLKPQALRFTVLCEFIATAFLIVAVIGSGIAAERMSGGNTALALLANALATGGALYALILTFAPLSGAHMNPVVTLAAACTGGFDWRHVPAYVGAQVAGGLCGTLIAHVMFERPLFQRGAHVRTGPAQWVAELVATGGLLVVVCACGRYRTPVLAGAVSAYIAGAYWFTASTSFANPAATIARAFTDTFAGIRPEDVAGFIAAQCAGLGLVLPFLRKLSSARPEG